MYKSGPINDYEFIHPYLQFVVFLTHNQALYNVESWTFFNLFNLCRGQVKCDGTRTETRLCLSAKWTGPFKSVGASVQSITGSQGERMSSSNAGYTMFWGSAKGTGYPHLSPVSPSFPHPCITKCHHILTGVYHQFNIHKFCVLPTVHLCVLHGSQNKRQLFPCTALTYRFL